ncbi:MAG: hypothetical protein ACM3VS_01000 [Candidatus Dadabacteria bacterium]
MRSENNTEKRRRRILQKGPILVRSAKAGENSVLAWQRESESKVPNNLWKNS